MPLNAIAPTGAVLLSASAASSRAAVVTTGSPTYALVSNLGAVPVFITLGDGTVVADSATGCPVMPGQQLAFTLGTATYIACSANIGASGVHVTFGV